MPKTKGAQRVLIDSTEAPVKKARQPGHKGNDLDGATWTRYSISVWNDIRKGAGEVKLGHPAMFPASLVERLVDCFTTHDDKVILDPFLGSGSMIIAAEQAGKVGIGFEISDDYIELAKRRLKQGELFVKGIEHQLIKADARLIEKHVDPNSVSLCVTSPPYWNILHQKRSADGKAQRNYGDTVQTILGRFPITRNS